MQEMNPTFYKNAKLINKIPLCLIFQKLSAQISRNGTLCTWSLVIEQNRINIFLIANEKKPNTASYRVSNQVYFFEESNRKNLIFG